MRINIPAVPVDLDPNIRAGMLQDRAYPRAVETAKQAHDSFQVCPTEASEAAYCAALLHVLHLHAILEEYGNSPAWVDTGDVDVINGADQVKVHYPTETHYFGINMYGEITGCEA